MLHTMLDSSCSSDDLDLSQPSTSKVIKQNNYSTFRTLLCRCSFSVKYVKYDSMVNKK